MEKPPGSMSLEELRNGEAFKENGCSPLVQKAQPGLTDRPDGDVMSQMTQEGMTTDFKRPGPLLRISD